MLDLCNWMRAVFSGVIIIIVFSNLPLSNMPWNLQLYNLQIITKERLINHYFQNVMALMVESAKSQQQIFASYLWYKVLMIQVFDSKFNDFSLQCFKL